MIPVCNKEFEKLNVELMADRCPQIKNFINNQQRLGYLEWFYGCGVLAFFPDGNNLVHKYSSLDSRRYIPRETERNYISVTEKLTGATKCVTFQNSNDLCGTCAYKGLLNSPITLGLDNPKFKKDDIKLSVRDFKNIVNTNEDFKTAYHNKKLTFWGGLFQNYQMLISILKST